MVHLTWLRAVGVDPDEFPARLGFGIDRMCALVYGLDDIRLLFENDVRFLNNSNSGRVWGPGTGKSCPHRPLTPARPLFMNLVTTGFGITGTAFAPREAAERLTMVGSRGHGA